MTTMIAGRLRVDVGRQPGQVVDLLGLNSCVSGEPGDELADPSILQQNRMPSDAAGDACRRRRCWRPVIRNTRMIAPLRGAHGAQDADLAALVLHQHDEARDDVEGRHQHDHRQDDEHHVALHLEHGEEAGVALAPVDEVQRGDAGLLHGAPRARPHLVWVVHDHLEHVDRFALVEKALRLGERHEDHAAVVLRHAHLEERHDLVGL